jgi:F0F1-type ATP synthase epsilon subunit
LKKGVIVYKDKKDVYEVSVDGGVVEVLNNKVIVLAESVVKEE